ncbi:MAG: excinuclease ABC subunit UvrA [Oscillospiraceae bacterium]|nr:excinuclease ABC subunit UvrA [Oscillospiraceae bacterium]
MARDRIIIKGARENNLKNIDLELPRDRLIVFTGLSGSGKSSLAFDTIYADGQRRYVESLSSYARMFLGQMQKPKVDSIEGLSPAVSIDQKTTSKNPRSTVGTVTEIYDYLRLLFARIGEPHCPVCGRKIEQQTIDQMVEQVMELPEGSRIQILAPVVRGRKGQHIKEFDAARRAGYARVRVNGSLYDLSEEITLDKNKKHTLEIVVDRLVVKEEARTRLTDSLETALAAAGGLVGVDVGEGEETLTFSQNYACPEHGVSVEELAPRMFSFNNPFGACPKCTGLGIYLKVDPALIIPNRSLSIAEGAIRASGWYYADGGIAQMYYEALSRRYGFSLRVPVSELPEEVIDILLYGNNGEKLTMYREGSTMSGSYTSSFEGVVHNLERRYTQTESEWMREEIRAHMTELPCPECHGDRLKKESLAVLVNGMNIIEFTRMSIDQAVGFTKTAKLTERQKLIGAEIFKEINDRLAFLQGVGLGYLTLHRSSGTLSGGESQRIRLATQIGSSLVGVLYILDEPSIGLHQKDNHRLIAALKNLRDIGNTVIVVEHDEDTMYASDFLVDIGPLAGVHGGKVVATGTVEDIKACPESITGQYLSGRRSIPVPEKRRKPNGHWLKIRGARQNNLKNLDIAFPLGVMTAVTGVSGSGKSTLVNEILYKTLSHRLNRARTQPGAHDVIEGIEYLDKVISIDQSPIGRTPRSNPATYSGTFTDIRNVFAQTNAAKMRGYGPGRFSFNIKGGRCEACEGDGIIKIEMHFLPDVFVPCEVCKGKRYNRETLEVKYKGKTIHDVLEMTVEEGLAFFENHQKIYRRLRTLYDVGLGYVRIGQSSTTLSGGEAQRVKLATELARRPTGRTVYILDEPTTGLHSADVHMLIEVLSRLVDGGNTVILIEHNLDVIKTADHVIDLGPEGGDKGGEVVAVGTPEQVTACQSSYTGQYLKKVLKKQ